MLTKDDYPFLSVQAYESTLKKIGTAWENFIEGNMKSDFDLPRYPIFESWKRSKQMGVPHDLKNAAIQGADPEFNKKINAEVMNKIENGPYYAIPQWPSVHHTMGGLTINEKTEVLDFWGNVIKGLYAAGEVTSGVHGTNRLGTNAIPDAFVHGNIAGHVAVSGTVPDFVPKE